MCGCCPMAFVRMRRQAWLARRVPSSSCKGLQAIHLFVKTACLETRVMPPSLQRVAFKAYTGIPTSVGSGTSTNLKAATDAVSSAASNAAEAANSAANTVMERMRANGWYGVHSSPPDGDGLSDDDCRSPSPQPRRGKAMKHIEDNHSEGESSSTGGEGWKIWQGAYDRVKWQSVGEKVKDAAAAVRKKYGTNDGLCGTCISFISPALASYH